MAIALSPSARRCAVRFHRIGGANQRRHLSTRLLDLLTDAAAEAMNARRIAIKLGVERQHRFGDFRQDLSGSIIVEVNVHNIHTSIGNRLADAAFKTHA